MADAAFLRILVGSAIREVVGTAPSLAEQERALAAGMSALSDRYAGERVWLYVPKVGTRARVQRARAIRSAWTGANAVELAKRYGLSQRQVQRIVSSETSLE